MSATNHTTTIGLSQYISTDKPTYLTDYNGDMLAIDNAIAADRDSIATAQNKANTADGKADSNKTSIDTLNAQINGDPLDPSDTGLAGKVTDNSGDIDTIEALIGNGTPTTSNQTIIGAINGLEGAIAPREDGADLANSYAEGEQFARGGSVYTALTSLTAGTAFASLTLNTDYKNSDTLVEQITDVGSRIDVIRNGWKISVEDFAICTVTADGVKTYKQLYKELVDLMLTTANALPDSNSLYEIVGIKESDFGDTRTRRNMLILKSATSIPDLVATLSYISVTDSNTFRDSTYLHIMSSAESNCTRREVRHITGDGGTSVTMSLQDTIESVPANGATYSIIGNLWINNSNE